MTNKKYTAKDIQVLDEMEHIRLSPGMYIGSTETPTHLIEEVLDNSLDEAMAGYATIIAVMIDTKTNRYSVLDNGRGIPIENKTPVTISTKLFSGGKFQDRKTAYEISSGLHGIGLIAVNALSEEYNIEIFRDNKHAVFNFKDGKLKSSKTKAFKDEAPFSTKIEFVPNKKYFHELPPDLNRLRRRLTTASAELSNDISFVLVVDDKKEVFNLNVEEHFVSSTFANKDDVQLTHLVAEKKPETFEIIFGYDTSGQATPKTMSCVNLLPVNQGGSHVYFFQDTLKDFFMSKAKKHGFDFQPTDVMFRLRAYLTLKMVEPKFSSQTKEKLTNHKSEFKHFESEFKKQLETFANENEELLVDYLNRFSDYRRKMDAKKLKTNGSNGRRASTQFTKLRDCTGRNGELYIVEGDSAAGCCLGSTEIKLVDGRDVTISDLVKENLEGKENFIYAYDHEMDAIVIEKLQTPIKTKVNAELIKVNIDNEKYIICTPDHRFMLRDGSYVEAEKLKCGDSLMPLYTKRVKSHISRKSSDNRFLLYEKVLQPSGKYKMTHWLSDEWNLRNKKYERIKNAHRHHIDKNPLNNNPHNIIRLTKGEHVKIHNQDSIDCRNTEEYREYMSSRMKEISDVTSKNSKKMWEDDDYKNYMKEKWKEFYDNNEEYRTEVKDQLYKSQLEYWSSEENRKQQSERTTEYYKNNPNERIKRQEESKKQWKNEELLEWRSKKTREQFSDPNMMEKKLASERKTRLYNCMLKIKELGIEEYKEFRKLKPKKYMKIETIIEKFFGGSIEDFNCTLKNYNHKVVSVEKLDYRDDVYDLEVPNYHNFATSAGVFIHNSLIQSRNPRMHAVLPLRGKSIPNVTTKKSILNNKEVGELIRAIGTGIDPQFDLSKMRYDKIICATDADHDGNHIACLVTMVIAVLLPEIIKNGRYFIAQTPLYAINEKKLFKPLWTERTLNTARNKGRSITRFKGLGELSPHQLKICLVDEKTRNHMLVKYSDNIEDLIKLFSSAEEKRKLVS